MLNLGVDDLLVEVLHEGPWNRLNIILEFSNIPHNTTVETILLGGRDDGVGVFPNHNGIVVYSVKNLLLDEWSPNADNDPISPFKPSKFYREIVISHHKRI
ncbi:hypothetical protein AB6A40_002168 [Gnathostoma spinigerum]|uniref:Uncharacterized protein n=1 Tax=Gnathostoma spinigerum TaxID=75299 RepID=A0ABD6EBE0_9BILA